MSVVGLGAVRSCGVTTAAYLLASTWREARRGADGVVLAECDPAGGALAGRLGLAPEPGLVSLAAAARRRAEPGLVLEHSQRPRGGPAVLVGPPSGEQSRAALTMLTGVLGGLGALEGDVLVDCGRLDPPSPVLDLWSRADLALMLVRPELADLQALSAWLPGRTDRVSRLAVVLVGSGPYPPGEVAEALGVEVVGALPFDPHGAALTATAGTSGRAVSRAPLVRAARTLAERLAARLDGEANDRPTAQPGVQAGQEPPTGDAGGGGEPATTGEVAR